MLTEIIHRDPNRHWWLYEIIQLKKRHRFLLEVLEGAKSSYGPARSVKENDELKSLGVEA